MILKKLVVKTGTVCTLRCEKCGEFNPYYKAKGKEFFVEAKLLSEDVFRIANVVDMIEVLHIAGGEALAHKDLAIFLAYVNSLKNIKSIELVSNGTIIPANDVLNVLEGAGKDKIRLLISDYSGSGINNEPTIEFLEKTTVNFTVIKDMVWKDKSDVSKKELSEEDLEYITDNCSTYRRAGYFTLIDGIVSAHCPTAGSLMYYLELYENMKDSWFDLRKIDDILVLKELKKLDTKKTIDACKYCTPSYKAADIPAGVQIKKDNDHLSIEELANLDHIIDSKQPIYMIGCRSKTALALMDMMEERNRSFNVIFDDKWQEIKYGTQYKYLRKYYSEKNIEIKSVLNNYDKLARGSVIVAMEEKYQRKWLKRIGGSYHKVFDGYDFVFYKEYADCIAQGGANKSGLSMCRNCRASFRSCPVRRDYYERTLEVKRDKVLRHVADKLGYICNLKCEYCCEFLPQFKEHHKKKFNWKQEIDDIRKLSDSLEYINCLSLSGGDVMLNRDLWRIIDDVVRISNIGDIYVLTNGTYVPHKDILDSLERNRERIHVIINDYECNDDAKGIVEELKDRGVNYQIRPNEGWYDLNRKDFRNRTVNELKDIYEHCSFDYNDNYYYIIFNGKMNLRCGVASGLLYYLDKYNENSEDYVDIREYSEIELPKEIAALEDKEYLDICNYCESCTFDERCLQPAGAQRD